MAEWSHEFEGPAHRNEAGSMEEVRAVLGEFVESVSRGDRYVMLVNKARFHQMLAFVDSKDWIDRILVALADKVQAKAIVIFPRPDDFVPPVYPKARYGLKRCAWCALRLPWWRWDILPYCDACKPDPRQGGRPRLGRRMFARGSRWDSA